MRVLLDNNVHVRFGKELSDEHEIAHCRDFGWQALRNGDLVRAADGRFEAMITVDKNMAYQTSLRGLKLAVLVLDAHNNGLSELRLFVPKIEAALHDLSRGEYTWLRK